MREKHFYEFGPFRLDASIPVLMRNGDIVALTPKALDTLLVLVRNAGNVVDKETLIEAVWPSAYVEESNLAQHISALRRVFGDGNGAAIRIETVSKRGYRLTGKVIEVPEVAGARAPLRSGSTQNGADAMADAAAPLMRSPESRRAILPRRGLLLAIAVSAALVAMAFALSHWPPRGGVLHGKQRQLTANTEQDPVLRSAISPDGKYLAYSDQAGVHVLVTETGESRLLTSPENLCFR